MTRRRKIYVGRVENQDNRDFMFEIEFHLHFYVVSQLEYGKMAYKYHNLWPSFIIKIYLDQGISMISSLRMAFSTESLPNEVKDF